MARIGMGAGVAIVSDMTDAEKIKRLEVAVERLCQFLQKRYGGIAGWKYMETELELIKQHATGKLG
jgi:hypothetical protein